MATQAHLEGNKRYMAKLDRGVFYVQKGNLEKIKAHAKDNGKSLNAYIVGLIEAISMNGYMSLSCLNYQRQAHTRGSVFCVR